MNAAAAGLEFMSFHLVALGVQLGEVLDRSLLCEVHRVLPVYVEGACLVDVGVEGVVGEVVELRVTGKATLATGGPSVFRGSDEADGMAELVVVFRLAGPRPVLWG